MGCFQQAQNNFSHDLSPLCMSFCLVCTLAEGVQHLHMHGIAHRDLKPSNIMFKDQTEDSPVKIIDYDLAKANYSTSWYGGTPVGTTNFMAPEIVQKQRYCCGTTGCTPGGNLQIRDY